jgi:hypothetical protein
MEEEVLVTIEYIGLLASVTMKKNEKIFVPHEISQAMKKIREYLITSYKIDKNYSILINKKRVSEFTNDYLQNSSTIITVIPVLSGG